MSDANRKAFEIWSEQILGDNPTWKESGDCELAWRAWLAALRAQPDHSELAAKLRVVAKYHRADRQESDDAVILAAADALEGKP